MNIKYIVALSMFLVAAPSFASEELLPTAPQKARELPPAAPQEYVSLEEFFNHASPEGQRAIVDLIARMWFLTQQPQPDGQEKPKAPKLKSKM